MLSWVPALCIVQIKDKAGNTITKIKEYSTKAYTEGDAKPEMVEMMMTESGNAIDWLHYEHGFEFDYVPKTGFTAARSAPFRLLSQ